MKERHLEPMGQVLREDHATESVPFSYRASRRFYQFLTNIWFREIDIVDHENMPPEGGLMYITWHPSGLIDPMLMTSVLPGDVDWEDPLPGHDDVSSVRFRPTASTG